MSELEVLDSIYPDFIVSVSEDGFDGKAQSVKLEIPIQLGQLRNVRLVERRKPEPTNDDDTFLVEYLPPILLDVILPEDYLSRDEPPKLSIRCGWMTVTQLLKLNGKLLGIWRQGEGVLYDWVELIRSGDFLDYLGLCDSNGIITLDGSAPQLRSDIISFDESSRTSLFTQASFSCAVCLTSIKGAKCMKLRCQHVFCRTCLLDYWSFSITEGSVEKLGCPDPECVKNGRESDEEEIARVVPEQLVQRWRALKQKIMFEKDPTLVHCPMVFCQSPVPRPPESETDAGGDRLRICPACQFSFCGFCKRTWHGAVQDCVIAHSEAVVREYLALPQDSADRRLLELRYGAKLIHKLVANYEEEQLNKKWLEDSTQNCPGCSLSIEKSMGCNHMTCARCKMHFCYRCGEKLQASDPYKHFSATGTSCYNKLFDYDPNAEGDFF